MNPANLIGTGICCYCGKLTKCLSLPDCGNVSNAACQDCITDAFTEIWGDDYDEDVASTPHPRAYYDDGELMPPQ